jgi:tetratricopeptide (TPR) repeat protein
MTDDISPSPQERLQSARVSASAGDIAGALSLYAASRSASDRPDPWFEAARLLTGAGLLDEAETLLREGVERFPDSYDMAIDHAWSAHRRHDLEHAKRRWSEICCRFAEFEVGHIHAVISLRELGCIDEARAFAEQAISRFPQSEELLTERARLGQQAGDWSAAADHWEALRRRSPDVVDGFVRGVEALTHLERYDEAETVLREALIRFPERAEFDYLWVEMAGRRGDPVEAASRWLVLRRGFPADPRCWIEAMRALNNAGDAAAADLVITDARGRFNDNFAIATMWAEAAERRADWSLAAVRWGELWSDFPDQTLPWTRSMLTLTGTPEPRLALDVARRAADLFPTDKDIHRTAGEVAVRCADFNAAAAYFKVAYEIDSNDLGLATSYVDTLLWCDRRGQARAVVGNSLLRWPDDDRLGRWSVELAMLDKDFADAMTAWRGIRDRSDGERAVATEMAMLAIRAQPPADMLEELIDFLAAEADTGERYWSPAFARLGDFYLFEGRQSREIAVTSVSRRMGTMSEACRLQWKALVCLPLTEEEMLSAFEQYLSRGRMPLIATISSNSSFFADPTTQRRSFTAFARYIDRRIASPEWIREDNALELLSYLMFATVASFDTYRLLVRAGLDRLQFRDISDDAAPVSAETALARLLRSARPLVADTSVLNSPAMIAPVGRLHVALCVSGQLRGFERAYPTWGNLGLQDHVVSTFVHTWRDVGRHWVRMWLFLRDYPALYRAVTGPGGTELLCRRFPRLGEAVTIATEGIDDIIPEQLKVFYNTEHVVVEDGQTAEWHGKPNVWKMHHKIERAHAMATAAMPENTLYIKIRPDQAFVGHDAIDWEKIYYESKRDRMLFADLPFMFVGERGVLKMADCFLAGARQPMDAFANFLPEWRAVTDRGATLFDVPASLHPHTSVAYSTFYNGVSARYMPGLRFGGLLDPTVLPPRRMLTLLSRDIGDNPKDEFERDFLEACRRAVGPD